MRTSSRSWHGSVPSMAWLAIGTMNRGGIIGARWELDDRLTAYDADHIAEYGLDGGKTRCASKTPIPVWPAHSRWSRPFPPNLPIAN